MKKVILALDVCNFKQAERLIKKTSPYIDIYKVGPILFIQSGKKIIKMIKENGKKVFLDLKFHDIPNTVKRSVESARDLGVFSLTVHSAGGEEMLECAVSVEKRPKIWAVSILTSQIVDLDEVIKRSKMSKSCGLDGVISSPLEVKFIKKECGKEFSVVTPGIRFEKCYDDQKRVATPKVAIKNGADFIIIGRPVLESKDPVKVLKDIYKSIKI